MENKLDKIIYKNMLKFINEKDFNVKYKIIKNVDKLII